MNKLRQSPLSFGATRSNWTVELIRQYVFSGIRSYSGAHHRLRRLGFGLRQGRIHICSPDPDYTSKVDAVRQALSLARRQPERYRLFYADEVSFHRIGDVKRCWVEHCNRPLMVWNAPTKNNFRVLGGMDAVSGQVVAAHRKSFTAEMIMKWLEQLRLECGPDILITVAWDNWPTHKSTKLLQRAAELNIEILFVPTYAPWTNPIEKLWRMMRQEITNMYAVQDREGWIDLRVRVKQFIDQFRGPSHRLIKYVGLEVAD